MRANNLEWATDHPRLLRSTADHGNSGTTTAIGHGMSTA